jgi:transcriptional regulator with XRE-family HTH domain
VLRQDISRDALSIDLVKALSGGTHPIRVWRAHSSRYDIPGARHQSRISRGYLYLIEMRKRPGTHEVLLKIAGALRVPPDNIIAWL